MGAFIAAFLIGMGVTAWNVEMRKEAQRPRVVQVEPDGCWWRVGSDGVTRYTCPEDPEGWAKR